MISRFMKCALTAVLVLSTVASGTVYGAGEEKTENVALGKPVTATTTYIPGEGWYSEQFLTDGKVEDVGDNKKLGWSSNPTDTSLKDDTRIDLDISLLDDYTVNQVRLRKCIDTKFFPMAYEVSGSTDGKTWTKLTDSSKETEADEGMTKIMRFDNVKVRYIRVTVTQSSGRNDWGAYLSQIGEIEVYGSFSGTVVNEILKTALRMNPGDTDKLKIFNAAGTVAATWSSDDASVATVDSEGKVTAVALGTTTLRGKDPDGKEFTCSILVDNYKVQEKFMITTFRSPSKANLNAKSYDLLKQAGITNVQNEWNTGTNSAEDNLLMAKLAYERGMEVTVAETNWRDGFLGLTEAEIEARIEKYTHVPGVCGFYILDEPYNPNPYAHAFPTIHKLMPTADIHVNMLPLGSYGDYKLYQAQANDWVQTCGTDTLGYLMYDFYPFTSNDTNFAEEALLYNLNAIREVGLKTGVKTGAFIQSIGRYKSQTDKTFAGLRIPSSGDVRLQVNYTLAYGMKQIGYFCWETPVYDAGTEAFTPAIVDRNGEPTPLFYDVCEINAAVNALGPTLMKLDSVEVYTVGQRYSSTERIPADFFFTFGSKTQAIVSYMRDKTTGENYCMIVNRDNVNDYTLTFTANAAIDTLYEISQTDGSAVKLDKGADGVYTLTFKPGQGRLLKLPESYDYTPDYGKRVTADGENLALGCEVGGSSSVGSDGKYFTYATDGVSGDTQGWQPNGRTNEYLQIDLANVLSINKVDVLPMKPSTMFPRVFTVSVSTDGINWTEAAKADFSDSIPETPSVTFPDMNARYVRITVAETTKKSIQISEVGVYGIGTVEIPETEPSVTTQPAADSADTSAIPGTSGSTEAASATDTTAKSERSDTNRIAIAIVAMVAGVVLVVGGVLMVIRAKSTKKK